MILSTKVSSALYFLITHSLCLNFRIYIKTTALSRIFIITSILRHISLKEVTYFHRFICIKSILYFSAIASFNNQFSYPYCYWSFSWLYIILCRSLVHTISSFLLLSPLIYPSMSLSTLITSILLPIPLTGVRTLFCGDYAPWGQGIVSLYLLV